MRVFAGVLDVVFVAVAFGARTWQQLRTTGDAGWRLGRPHNAAAGTARALMFAGGLSVVAAAVASHLASTLWFALGVAVAVVSIVFVAIAQLQMGESWRIGVDPNERTALVTSGVYAQVRNPIYSGMVAFTVGQALLLPGVWSVGGIVAMTLGVVIQARAVEEPYLLAVHGPDFERWSRQSGRFVPRFGRMQ